MDQAWAGPECQGFQRVAKEKSVLSFSLPFPKRVANHEVLRVVPDIS